MFETKYIKIFGLVIGVVILNILVLSPGFLGVEIGGSALSTAFGVTLLFASALVLLYGSYHFLYKQPDVLPVKKIKTHEDFEEALSHYKKVRVLEGDIHIALHQMDRIRKKKDTLIEILNQRFEPAELSYKKFDSVIQEVEKLFYLNIKSVLNRLSVFDEAEYESVMNPRAGKFSPGILQERTKVYNEFLTFVKSSLNTNEEILLKLDKLMLEISRLDSLEIEDIENMPCMQEIDSLIKQTKFYKN